MFRTLKTPAAFPALLASALLITPGMVNAATMTAGDFGGSTFEGGYATGIQYDNAALRGDLNNRDNAANALGNDTSTFFEIGLGSSVDLTFGRDFVGGPATVWEITNGNRDGWVETADVYAVLNGVETFVTSITNATEVIAFTIVGGPFDTLRIKDTSGPPPQGTTGGFDIASVKVTPVPLPAAAWLFGSALVGVGIIGRRKKRQAGDAAA